MIVALYPLFVAIHLTASINVDIPLTTYEFARGGNAVLPCKFQPAKPVNTKIIITWTAHPDVATDIPIDILTYFYSSTEQPELDISSEFADRASFQVDVVKGWGNLTLNSLKSQDSRVFQCEVKIPGDRTGKPSDVTNVVVLVAPSPPICAIQGKAEFYQNISLTCRSEEGTPEPTYKWQSYDVTNNPRPNPPKATDVKGVLSLFNISAETSGYYICTSSNKIQSASCNLTLSVMPYSMNLGSTAAIAGGCAAALVLLVIIICCCCRHRRKKAAEEYAMGLQEDCEDVNTEQRGLKEYQDKRVESKAEEHDRNEVRSDHYDDRRDRDDRQGRPDNRQYDSDRYDDRRSDRYDDRRSDRYDDRRNDRYDDRRNDRYDDRRNDRYDDRRNDRYDDRRNDCYDDRRSDRYDDRRSDRYDDRRSEYDDRQNDRYDDRRRQDDRYDDRRVIYDHPDDHYDDRSRPPNVPANKPTRG